MQAQARRAREEAFTLTRSRTCDGCGEERECARLEPLAVEERWYCGPCWDYQLGRMHGRRQALQEISALTDDLALR